MMGEFYDCPQLRQGEYCEAVYAAMELMIGKNRSIQTVRLAHGEVCTTLCDGVIRNKRGGMAEMWGAEKVFNKDVPFRTAVLFIRFTCSNCRTQTEVEQGEPSYSSRWKLYPTGWSETLCDKCNSAGNLAAAEARRIALEQIAGKRD